MTDLTAPANQDWDALKARVDVQLRAITGAPEPDEPLVRTAVRESVMGAGKRVRPILVDLAARDLGYDQPAALQAGCAIELVHTASLLLDDLPCMDDALTRRGKPTVHIRFGEDVAVLAAIAMLGDAFGLAASVPGLSGEQRSALTLSLSQSVGMRGLVAGQYSDLRNVGNVSENNVVELNDQKTGSLFVSAVEMAGILADASAMQREQLRIYGLELGRAFQLFDDLLDVAGDAARMGKSNNKDAGKAVLAQGLGSKAMAERIQAHLDTALHALDHLPDGAPNLRAFTDKLFGKPAAGMQPHGGGKNGSVLTSLLA
ncbi:polyprenyl synthetase family protein [Tianweitania sp. BSSL-BM11]|uniref:Polyprenyl synthetase family protein n=1 Tax=Tianweitania aestuarii TaxID=2814886 RepID=A0ABS5RRZ6_9HYPH|nr:polyprenyl synthetase family protein [Tianweitania aestuarii]MBS9719087.1 polyprenyl synthetase family protein [Tianweitania aestuarii]